MEDARPSYLNAPEHNVFKRADRIGSTHQKAEEQSARPH